METEFVAVYLDFENIAISADKIYPSLKLPLQIEPIVDFASGKGTVTIKKAYANWNHRLFGKYQRMLVEQGFELVHLPETKLQGKSWADVRLTVDVMEDLALYTNIKKVVIGSEDTDFVPLLQRIIKRGMDAVVLGFEANVGNLLKKNSTEFKSISEVIGKKGETFGEEEAYDVDALMGRFLKSNRSDGPVLMTQFKQLLLKLDSSFSERKLGYKSFKAFVQSLKGPYVERIEVDKDKDTTTLYFAEPQGNQQVRSRSADKRAKEFLAAIKYVDSYEKRMGIAKSLLKANRNKEGNTLNELISHLGSDIKVPKLVANRFVYQLNNTGLFREVGGAEDAPLNRRKLRLAFKYRTPEAIESAYIDRVRYLLPSRFPELDEGQIKDLMKLGTGN